MQWQVSLENIGTFLVERGFFDRVLGNRDHFKAQWPRVLQAMLMNALNAERVDQFTWMERFREEISRPPPKTEKPAPETEPDALGEIALD
jgi:hypothetical protein